MIIFGRFVAHNFIRPPPSHLHYNSQVSLATKIVMDQLATQQSQNMQEAITRYLPLLSKVLNTINPTHAAAWIIPFANAGITDASFPTSVEAMKNTCEGFGIKISPI